MDSMMPVLFLIGMIIMALSETLNRLDRFIPDYRAEVSKLMGKGIKEEEANQRARRKIRKARNRYHYCAFIAAIVAAISGYMSFT